MHDLISRQSAIDTHCELCSDCGKCPDICPDVEVFRLIAPATPDLSAYSDKLWRAAYERGKKEAEAERKRGKWLPDNRSYEIKFICSCCKESEVVPTTGFTRYEPIWKYCPNCGADMRGGDEDEQP